MRGLSDIPIETIFWIILTLALMAAIYLYATDAIGISSTVNIY